jgi:hypothetical protein
MANEKFKVKFGLAVGDTAATIDGTTGNIVTTGDIAVNGGDVTTTSATGTLFNTGATTVNIGGAATYVTIASTGGSTQIRNALTIDASATVGTDLTVFGGDIITTAATASVFNTGATTLNIGGAATTVGIGATTGTTTVKNSLQVDGNTTLGSNTSDEVTVNANNITFSFNDTATPRGILGQTSTGAVDYWFIGGAETGGTSDAGFAMIATGDNGSDPIYARQYNGSPLSGTVNKQLTLLDASGNTTIPGDLTVDGGDIITANATSTLFNTVATTLNIGGAATTVSIGANTGTTTINNSLVADDISITTVDTTNLEVTNIKAKDGTAAMIIADSTGLISVSTQFIGDSASISRFTRTVNSGVANVVLELTRNRSDSARIADQGPWLGLGYVGTDNTQATAGQNAIRSMYDATGNHKLQFLQIPSGNYATPTTIGQVQRGSTFFNTTAGVANLFLSDATARIGGTTTTITNSANTATYATFGSTFTNLASSGVNYAQLGTGSNTFTTTAASTFIRQGTINTIQPAVIVRYQRTDTTGSNDGDGVDFRLGTGGTSTVDNIARFDAQYKTSGFHQVGISVSTDSFSADTDTVYRAQADKTIIRATPTGTTGTASDILTVESTKITSAVPIKFPTYTAAAANAITGAVGWQISISDSAGAGNPNGMMAFWDTTNARWSYIHDNTAV